MKIDKIHALYYLRFSYTFDKQKLACLILENKTFDTEVRQKVPMYESESGLFMRLLFTRQWPFTAVRHIYIAISINITPTNLYILFSFSLVSR